MTERNLADGNWDYLLTLLPADWAGAGQDFWRGAPPAGSGFL